MIVGNLQYLRVTGGTLGWAFLYAVVLCLWWKYDRPPELGLLVILAVVGVLALLFTLEYPLVWMRTRRREFRQVMKAYYDYKALRDALDQLRNELDKTNQQLEPERHSNGQAGV